VALGPAEVHAQEHLGPIGRFRAARAGADRQEGVALVVLTAEEKLAPRLRVFAVEVFGIFDDVGEKRLVVLCLGQVQELACGLGSRLEIAPQLELFSQTFGLA
jgi:hypothetical protein